MEVTQNIEWFKQELAPKFKDYEVEYRYYEKGDFGSLNQVEFNSLEKGGNP